jgi:integrase
MAGGAGVGQSRRRIGKDGRPRYTAYYTDLRGRRRSAGTYATKKEANDAWRDAEVKLREGRVGDPRRGRQRFERYVLDEWLPNHVVELTTRQTYTYLINRYLVPGFSGMAMADILPSHVREWVANLVKAGVGRPTVKMCKTILSAIFTTALNDQVTFLHACQGVKTPPVAVRPRRIITADQFERIYAALGSDDLRLLIETDIETGMRWGELAELRVRDLDFTTGILTVSRVVVELSPAFHPEGGRFLVKDYPKDKEYRRFRISDQLVAKIELHVKERELADDDLLFVAPPPVTRRRVPTELPDPTTLGLTEPNANGRQYRHGTLSGYTAGRCRCRHCKDAYASYRAQRRESGLDHPRQPRARDTDGHISRDWFRRQVWKPAVEAAEVPFTVRVHDLRHAHASWLLAGGADLQVVKERLGHATITTTEKYLHTLPEADTTALAALAKIRSIQPGSA